MTSLSTRMKTSKYIDEDHYTYGYEDDLEENIIGENSIKAYITKHQEQGPFIRKENNEVHQPDICTFQNLQITVLFLQES